ncbi:MAG: diacylglycerol/lipid kinase family protein [Candidatus Limnocylindrales bacterium]
MNPTSLPPIRFIAHPGAGRGAFARVWPALSQALSDAGLAHEVLLTTRALEAADMARQAVRDGTRLVVAVGGDGTLHEVVNGLMTSDASGPELPALGLVPAGRGSDYARGLGLPSDPVALVARFAAAVAGDPAASHAVDVGEATYRASPRTAGRTTPPSPLPDEPPSDPQEPVVRYVINCAGIGFSPFVAQRTARFPPRLGAYLYTAAALITVIDWHDRAVELHWADGQHERRAVESIELALGRYEGGGMLVAPDAEPSDGLFDAVIIGAISRVELTTFSWRVRSGDHLRSPQVEVRRTAGLVVTVADERGPLYLQGDGELLGRDPFAVRVLPSALRFVW